MRLKKLSEALSYGAPGTDFGGLCRDLVMPRGLDWKVLAAGPGWKTTRRGLGFCQGLNLGFCQIPLLGTSRDARLKG